MRKPMKQTPPGRQRAGTVKTIPAPVKGWNARDPVAQMGPLYAIVLDNIIPRSSDVTLRAGASNFVTGFTGTVRSLMPYSSTKLFGTTDAGIYDVTVAGAVGAAVATITNGIMIHENFNTAGTPYLYCVNGVDKPQLYNGAAWVAVDGASVPALTGLTTTSISYVKMFKKRLWFIEKASTSLWYLAAGAIGGALTKFDVGDQMSRGGTLVACGSWSFDGGDGPDDYFVIITSEGEALIYKGTDPASASTFGIVGVYYVGVPLGAKCLCKFGGDLLYLCSAGAVPLSKLLLAASIDRNIAITSNIDNAFVAAVASYGSNYGWEAQYYQKASLLIVNVPATADASYNLQYVMNMVTGGWCRFTGLSAACFQVFREELYFGAVGKTVWALTGVSDFDANIVGVAQQAYNYFNSPYQKDWTMVRPILVTSEAISVAIGLDVDFDLGGALSSIAPAPNTSAVYDTDEWDAGIWGPDTIIDKQWRTIAAKPGFCAAFRMQISTKQVQVSWQTTDFVVTFGGVL